MSTTSSHASKNESIGVQAMEVGLRLLRPLVDSATHLNLKTLAEAVDFSPPKAHRYLVSLIRAGLVQQDEAGRYGLGQLAMELGLTALGMLDRDRLGRSAVAELRLETDHTAAVVVWGSGGPTVAAVETSASAGSVYLAMRIGSPLSLIRSASGHVFISHLPRQTIWSLLERERRQLKVSVDSIDTIIANTRRRGYSTVTDTLNPGVSAISAPVFDHDGRLVYAFTSIGQTKSFSTTRDSPVLRMVLDKARTVSKRLGCTDSTLRSAGF